MSSSRRPPDHRARALIAPASRNPPPAGPHPPDRRIDCTRAHARRTPPPPPAAAREPAPGRNGELRLDLDRIRRHQPTTMFTSRPLMTITLRTVFPASRAATFASPRAAASHCESSASAATRTVPASLPIHLHRQLHFALDQQRRIVCRPRLLRQRLLPRRPASRSHNSSATCGANGASRSTTAQAGRVELARPASPRSQTPSLPRWPY